MFRSVAYPLFTIFTFTMQLEKAGKAGTVVIYDNLKKVGDKTKVGSGCQACYSDVPNPAEKLKG